MGKVTENESMANRAKNLFQIVENLGILRRFQRDFYILTGLPFDLVDLHAFPSRRLKSAQDFIPFYNLILETDGGRAACVESNRERILRLQGNSKPGLYAGFLGLMEMMVPIVMGGQVIGVLASGQFLLKKPTRKSFRALRSKIQSFGIPLALAEKHYLSVPVLTPEKADAVVDLLALIADHILNSEIKLCSLGEHHESDPLCRAKKFIENHFDEGISIRDVATEVCLSSSRLAHLFRNKMNTNFVAYRNQMRIEQSKFLLVNTDLQIVEIAMKAGFSNLGHFNKLFKKEVGDSPRGYRLKHITGTH